MISGVEAPRRTTAGAQLWHPLVEPNGRFVKHEFRQVWRPLRSTSGCYG